MNRVGIAALIIAGCCIVGYVCMAAYAIHHPVGPYRAQTSKTRLTSPPPEASGCAEEF